MNKYKAIMELTEKAQMQQSIEDALRCLDEWEWKEEDEDCNIGKYSKVNLAMYLLQQKSKEMGKEIDKLQNEAAGGEFSLEDAFENIGERKTWNNQS